MTELLQGRNPLNLIRPRPTANLSPTAHPLLICPAPARPPPTTTSHPTAAELETTASRPRPRGAGSETTAAPMMTGTGPVMTRTAPVATVPKAMDQKPTATRGSGTRMIPAPTTPTTSETPGVWTSSTTPATPSPITPSPATPGPDGAPAWTPDEAENARYGFPNEPDDLPRRRGPLRPGESAPPPANLNLIVPIGTMFGWSSAPAQADGFGLLDPEETQALVAAASRHPRTRWSITLVDPSGQAVAHGRARGQHPWDPPPPARPPRNHPEPHHRTPPRAHCFSTSSAPSTSSSSPSPGAPAITSTPRTATPPAASSETSFEPAP